jgi:hypothetical protein
MKIAKIPKEIFCVKKYIRIDPNKIESGINIWISVIVFTAAVIIGVTYVFVKVTLVESDIPNYSSQKT